MIKELNRFSKELKLFRTNNALPQGDVKNALVDIYEANWHNNKRWGSSTIGRNCPSCISDMMKSLAAAFESNQVEFKGVPTDLKIVEYHKLGWGELKSYAASKGINTKGKKKVVILEELKELGL